MDVSIVARSGKKAWIIGLSTFAFPMVLTILSSRALKSTLLADHKDDSLSLVAMLHATTTFHGVSCFLGDLKLLNSEVGRLALSSSMISGSLGYATVLISFGVNQIHPERANLGVFYIITMCAVAQFVLIKAGMGPFVSWMIRQTPRGQPLKESYLCYTVLLVLMCAFIGEVCGQHTFFGPILLGIALPAGSILAATLSDKFEGFITLVLLPLYFLACGGKTDLRSLDAATAFACALMALIGALTKFLAAVVPCVLFFNMIFRDAAILSLILSTVGVLDIQFYSRANQLGLIDAHCFSVMNTTSIIITGLISPMVQVLYDPSIRYISRKRQTIQDEPPNGELRVLACVHTEEQVPEIIDLLRVSNPTKQSPLGIYLIHLRELIGGAAPKFVSLESGPSLTSDSITNAFLIFERSNESVVSVQPFTAIAPFTSMHNDVCTLALDRGVSFTVLPFHCQWNSDGYVVNSPKIREFNRKVLSKAPCSVGILINRRSSDAADLSVIEGAISTPRVGVFFTGGPDDREALAYATCIAKQPDVKVTVVRFISSMENIEDEEEKSLDEEVISEFKLRGVGSKRARDVYKEEIVMDSVEICEVIRSMENSFDLILVGRRYVESPLMEWNEFPELGFIGDILASGDFHGKVLALVVQQHRYGGGKERDIGGSSRFSDIDLTHQTSFTPLQGNQKFAGLIT
ncbi:cation/H(+) antiporter 15-like [Punica granatum]|nr:cation/H(+) antiporter 15-like [Punica granatum]